MAATNGLEKFSHLEDKIYRTIEVTKALRQEKDDLERQLASARNVAGGKEDLAARIEHLTAEREARMASTKHGVHYGTTITDCLFRIEFTIGLLERCCHLLPGSDSGPARAWAPDYVL